VVGDNIWQVKIVGAICRAFVLRVFFFGDVLSAYWDLKILEQINSRLLNLTLAEIKAYSSTNPISSTPENCTLIKQGKKKKKKESD